MTIDKYPWPSKTGAHNHTIQWPNKALMGKASHIGNQNIHPLLYDNPSLSIAIYEFGSLLLLSLLTPPSSFSNLLHQNPVQSLDLEASGNMASEAPSWADQWGAGGIGAMEDDDTISQKETGKKKNSGSKGGFGKVKAIASNCVKWLKSLCKRKSTSK
ncbi:hypothetical protein HKD37_17G046539 [Glycine soja]